MNGERDERSVILCPISFGLFELFELPNSISGISSISQELLGLFKFIEVIDFSRVVSSYSSYSFEFSNRIESEIELQFSLNLALLENSSIAVSLSSVTPSFSIFI